MLNTNLTFYDVLEITPDASTEEIREAYLRIKSTYQKDHVALYTLFTAAEREAILQKAEEAYLTLSDSDKRRIYDQNHGLMVWEENPFAPKDPNRPVAESSIQAPPNHLAEVVSIDRSPPMESLDQNEDELFAPATDYSNSSLATKESDIRPRTTWAHIHHKTVQSAEAKEVPAPINKVKTHSSATGHFSATLLAEIQNEKEWPGSFLKKVRESLQITLEELSEKTKISKSYIKAIEDENFAKLPAPVYIRGFVTQIARTLKLPANEVANAYLSRYPRASAS